MVGQELEGEGFAVWHLYMLLVIFSSAETEKAIVPLYTIISLVSLVSVFIGTWQKFVLPIPNNRTASFP